MFMILTAFYAATLLRTAVPPHRPQQARPSAHTVTVLLTAAMVTVQKVHTIKHFLLVFSKHVPCLLIEKPKYADAEHWKNKSNRDL
jgi:hypothetical protein